MRILKLHYNAPEQVLSFERLTQNTCPKMGFK